MDRPGRNGGTLRSYEKGTSGNPAGRPSKQDLISELMREYGQEDNLELTINSSDINGIERTLHLNFATDGKETTIFAIIAVQLLMRACSGDFQAMKTILDRTEGQAPAAIRFDNPYTPVTSAEAIRTMSTKEIHQRLHHNGR